MKLALRLTLVLTLGVLVVIGALTTWSTLEFEERLVQRYLSELDARARMLSHVVSDAWDAGGRTRARLVVQEADVALGEQHLRWYDWRPEPPDDFPTDVLNWTDLAAGEQPVRSVGHHRVVAAAPVRVQGEIRAVVLITESLDLVREATGGSLRQRLLLAGLVVVVIAVLVFVFARRLVSVPLESYTEQAQRIAAGDLSARLPSGRNDEIGAFGRELNRMADALEVAWWRYEEEHHRRLATLAQLRHAERLKLLGQLVASVVHEMGTPLNVVQARARLVASGRLDEEGVASSAAVIDEQTGKLTARIQSLLGFARRESRMEERVSVSQLAEDAAEFLDVLFRKHRVEVALECDSGAVIRADPSQMEQVLVNLLTNAVQAMPDGGHITIGCAVEGDEVVFTVADDGVGMSPEVAERVFEPFFTTKERKRGTGLGLSVSRGIIEAHGGTMTVQSVEGEGTTFTMRMPLAGGDAPAPGDEGADPDSGQNAPVG